jgi:hypothetical protein
MRCSSLQITLVHHPLQSNWLRITKEDQQASNPAAEQQLSKPANFKSGRITTTLKAKASKLQIRLENNNPRSQSQHTSNSAGDNNP